MLDFTFICFSILYFCNIGLGSKQIYLKSGDSSSVAELLESFKKDARSVKLRAGKHQLEDVTDVLKSFLSQIDDALLTKELYPFWISALGNVFNNTQYKKGFMYIFIIKIEGVVNYLPCVDLHYLIISKTIVVRKKYLELGCNKILLIRDDFIAFK